jgi:hypothetical protein
MLVEGLNALLLADPATVALIGTPAIRETQEPDNVATTGVFAEQVPEGAALPLIVFGYAYEENQMTMDGPDVMTRARLEYSAQGLSYADAKHVARAMRKLFENFTGTLFDGSEVDSIRRISELDTFNDAPFFYVTSVEFEVWYRDLSA